MEHLLDIFEAFVEMEVPGEQVIFELVGARLDFLDFAVDVFFEVLVDFVPVLHLGLLEDVQKTGVSLAQARAFSEVFEASGYDLLVEDHGSLFFQNVELLLVLEPTENVAQIGNQDVQQNHRHYDGSEDQRQPAERKLVEVVGVESSEQRDHVRLFQQQVVPAASRKLDHQEARGDVEVHHNEEKRDQFFDDNVDHSHQSRERVENPEKRERPVEQHDQSEARKALVDGRARLRVEDEKVNQKHRVVDPVQHVPEVPEVQHQPVLRIRHDLDYFIQKKHKNQHHRQDLEKADCGVKDDTKSDHQRAHPEANRENQLEDEGLLPLVGNDFFPVAEYKVFAVGLGVVVQKQNEFPRPRVVVEFERNLDREDFR